MPEVLLGIAENLVNPKPSVKFVDDCSWPVDKNSINMTTKDHWSCNCTYCKLHILYTYFNIELNKAGRGCMNIDADRLYDELESIRVLKRKLELLPMDTIVIDHIKDAKEFIGRSFSSLRWIALDLRSDVDNIKNRAKYILATHGKSPLGRSHYIKKVSWF